MGALMCQIHMKPEAVLLDQIVLKETKCFSKQRENNHLIHQDNQLFVT